MSESSNAEPTTPAEPHGETENAETQGQEAPGTDWVAEARKWETRAKENAAAAKRLAEIEEAQKSEEQRQAERLASAESERDSAVTRLLRLEVAMAAELPTEAIDRLHGTTREELEEDAKKLQDLFSVKAKSERDSALVDPSAGKTLAAKNMTAAEQFAAYVNDNL